MLNMYIFSKKIPVNEEIFCQPFCSYDFEDDLVRFQGLEVHSTRQSRVQALSQTLPYDQPFGQEGVTKVTLQGLEGARKAKHGSQLTRVHPFQTFSMFATFECFRL